MNGIMASKLPLAPRQLLPKADPETSSASPVLDSIPVAGGEHSAKRRCISSACMPCRKRKSKCDGGKPACTACLEVYSSECHYDLDADHRRKGALKRDISHLAEKINTIGSVLDAIRTGSEADADDIVQLIRTNPTESHEKLAEMVRKMVENRTSDRPSVEPPSSLEGQLLMDFHGKASMDKTGLSTHYGHTSHLALQGPEEERAMSAEQVGAWTNVTSDTELINHLFEAYFSWSHPIYLLFSEELFYHGMRDNKPKYCTPLLVNAILAIGCHWSDRIEARADPKDPSTSGDHFFAEAKRLLAENDNTTSLTIVQALGLMSLRQAMNNHDSSGRRYVAQMMSMAVELGLHLSSSTPPGGNFTPAEIEARKVTFWGCFVLETIWAVCIGRLTILPRTAIRLERPALNPQLENTPWKPHGRSEPDLTKLTQPSMKYTLLQECSVLMEILDDILRSFYAPRSRITSRKLQIYHEQLRGWYRNLPTSLAIRTPEPTLPQVITLHLFYHNCIIMTFRPFMKVSFVQTSSETPRQICIASANTISQLLDLHKRTYGIRTGFFANPHCIMSAAIIHLVHLSFHPGVSNPEIETYLADAVRAMHEMMKGTVIVGRFLKIIRDLIFKWIKDIPPVLFAAMEEAGIATPHPSKSHTTNSPTTSNNSGNYHPLDPNGQKYNIDTLTINRKQSAPEILLTAPELQHTDSTTGSNILKQQDLFWTPYPESFEGVPLALPQQNNHFNSHMDITSVLDSGVNGDLPQWNRDGFTMGEEDGNMGGWGVDWDVGAG
ncbi:hypothetical protein BDZ45DRAFT_804928 [Acephala macrosclerotiorum]|nr:hypothetical protein BDZ45DRAFT_804928 [Acephala macrosclerotiorum]